jgi:hypothetical protein
LTQSVIFKCLGAQCGCGMLRSTVMRICDEVGGSVVQHSNGNVHVLHCPLWTCRATAILQRECPNATISVESSISSLSGFIVVAHQKKKLIGTGRRLFIAGLSTFMLFTLIWTLFGMQFDFSSPLLVNNTNWTLFPRFNYTQGAVCSDTF